MITSLAKIEKFPSGKYSFVDTQLNEPFASFGFSGVSKFMYRIHHVLPNTEMSNKINFAKLYFGNDAEQSTTKFFEQVKDDYINLDFNSTGMWVDTEFYNYTSLPINYPMPVYHFSTLSNFFNIDGKELSILKPEEDYKVVFSDDWKGRVFNAFEEIKKQNWNIAAFVVGNEVVWQHIIHSDFKNEGRRITNTNEAYKFFEQFCLVTRDVCKAVFPDTLYCANRQAGSTFKVSDSNKLTNLEFGNSIADISATYSDFLCHNQYRNFKTYEFTESRKLLESISVRNDKPYLITECTWHDISLKKKWFGMRYRKKPHYPSLGSQLERANAFVAYINEMMKSKYCLGVHFYSYLDHVDANWGCRDTVTNKIYEEFFDKLFRAKLSTTYSPIQYRNKLTV